MRERDQSSRRSIFDGSKPTECFSLSHGGYPGQKRAYLIFVAARLVPAILLRSASGHFLKRWKHHYCRVVTPSLVTSSRRSRLYVSDCLSFSLSSDGCWVYTVRSDQYFSNLVICMHETNPLPPDSSTVLVLIAGSIATVVW